MATLTRFRCECCKRDNVVRDGAPPPPPLNIPHWCLKFDVRRREGDGVEILQGYRNVYRCRWCAEVNFA